MESKSTPCTSNPFDEGVAPPKKRKMGHFGVNEKIIIINVFKYVKETWPTNKYPSKKEMKDKAADILGISRSTIYRVLKEYILTDTVKPATLTKPPPFMGKMDDFMMSNIRQIVHSFYLKNDLPTTKKVFQAVNADRTIPRIGLTTLRRILKQLKFTYFKVGSNSHLIEKNDVALWRIKYLKRIKTCRQQGQPIYYLHETCMKAEPSASYSWKDSNEKQEHLAFSAELSLGAKDPTPKRIRFIALHIAHEDGFLPNTELILESKETKYNDQLMNSEKFENWFQEMLHRFKPSSVLVMDNTSYYSRQCREKVPNDSWEKEDIQQWLSYKKISYEEHELKIQLFDKVKSVDTHQYNLINEMAKTAGVEVLTLPPYHCDLNPIELAFADLKGYATRNNTKLSSDDFKQFLQDVHNITTDEWQHCMSQVKSEEVKLRSLDNKIDIIMKKGLIDETDEMSDSSMYSEADSDNN